MLRARRLVSTGWVGSISAAILAVVIPLRFERARAQPPDIGIAPVALTQGSYTFDTAEQHRLRVVVVKGLKHPFAVALLPDGDALVSERGGALRLVHDVTGAGGRQAAGISGGCRDVDARYSVLTHPHARCAAVCRGVGQRRRVAHRVRPEGNALPDDRRAGRGSGAASR
ncbi:MAG TPA: hypothetical protein VHX52_02325 [Steroidobacteraceae bacterium]|jgi:glucose/arabinose dehydrogenase|nr:hypothetical protein [Steroidobacteraceae bacterium]